MLPGIAEKSPHRIAGGYLTPRGAGGRMAGVAVGGRKMRRPVSAAGRLGGIVGRPIKPKERSRNRNHAKRDNRCCGPSLSSLSSSRGEI